MDLTEQKKILEIMNGYVASKDWNGCLKELQAETSIPARFLGRISILRQLAYVYQKAAQAAQYHNRCLKLAVQAYEAILAAPGPEGHSSAYKGLAYLYYSEYISYYMWQRQIGSKLIFTKAHCSQKAEELLKTILVSGGDISYLYRYAYLIYRLAGDYTMMQGADVIHSKKEKAYQLYRQVIRTYEAEQDTELQKSWRRTYIKSCYGLVRCGLDLIASHSSIAREISLLFSLDLPDFGLLKEKKERLRDIIYSIDRVRQAEQLPVQIENMEAIVHSQQEIEKSWDVYYSMGKIYDFAFQYALLPDRDDCFQKAKKYYSYACEIDRIRREKKLPVPGFRHMYHALLMLYLRGRDEMGFREARRTYSAVMKPDEFRDLLYTVRWHCLKREYQQARETLLRYMMTFRKMKSGQKKQLDLLLDLLDVIDGADIRQYTPRYTAGQVRLFVKLQHLRLAE